MPVDLVQVLADLREASVARDLRLQRHLHVDLRRYAHLDLVAYLHDSSHRQLHLAPHLPCHLLPAQVGRADVPELVALLESIPHVLEIPGADHEYLLVGEVEQSGVALWGLQDLLELVDVGIEHLLVLVVVGEGLVGLVVAGELEEVFEGVELVLLVAVHSERVGRVWLHLFLSELDVEDRGQEVEFVSEDVVVGVVLPDYVRVVQLLRSSHD